MKNHLRLWIGSLATVFLLASCSSTAHIEKDDSVDFSQYRSFAWLDKDGEGTKDNDRRDDMTEDRIKQAVKTELEKSSGWRESKTRPDVVLSYDVLVERGTRESTSPVYSRPFSRLIYNPYSKRYATIYYPSQFMGYERDHRSVREGTITISMIDTKTDKVVWQGWTTEEVNNRNLSSREIQSAVKSIFKKFDLAKN
jgi:hypothetical protein